MLARLFRIERSGQGSGDNQEILRYFHVRDRSDEENRAIFGNLSGLVQRPFCNIKTAPDAKNAPLPSAVQRKDRQDPSLDPKMDIKAGKSHAVHPLVIVIRGARILP